MISDYDLPLMEHVRAGDRRLVHYRGDPCAELMVVGEAPGRDEDGCGKPFVGRSGELLENRLKRMPRQPRGVYVTNVIKVRPEGNRDPTHAELVAYTPYLLEEVRIVRPRYVLCLGAYSCTVFRKYFHPELYARGVGDCAAPVSVDNLYKSGVPSFCVPVPAGARGGEPFTCVAFFGFHPSAVLREGDPSGHFATCLDLTFCKLSEALERDRPRSPFHSLDDEEGVERAHLLAHGSLPAYHLAHEASAPPGAAAPGEYLSALKSAGAPLRFFMTDCRYLDKQNAFALYGRTAESHSVCVYVFGFRFHFYAKYIQAFEDKAERNAYTPQQLGSIGRNLSEALRGRLNGRRYAGFAGLDRMADVSVTLEEHQSFSKHQTRAQPMLRFEFSSHAASRDLARVISEFDGALGGKVKFFGADVGSREQFLLGRGLCNCCWVEVGAEGLDAWTPSASEDTGVPDDCAVDVVARAESRWVKGDDPKDPSTPLAPPLRVLALDAEMISKSGAFPDPARDPVASICTVEQTMGPGSLLERVRDRDPKGGNARMWRTRATGRSDYDQKTVFSLKSCPPLRRASFYGSDVGGRQHGPRSIPNPPCPPLGTLPYWGGDDGLRPAGGAHPGPCFMSDLRKSDPAAWRDAYAEAMMEWKEFSERAKEWMGYAGRRRVEWMLDPSAGAEEGASRPVVDAARSMGDVPSDRATAQELGAWAESGRAAWEERLRTLQEKWPLTPAGLGADVSSFESAVPLHGLAEGRPPGTGVAEWEEEAGTVHARWDLFHPAARVFQFETEAELLAGFFHYVGTYDPDFVTGYNVIRFDIWYIITRAEVLLVRVPGPYPHVYTFSRHRSLPSEITYTKFQSRAHGEKKVTSVSCPGRTVIDLCEYMMREHKLRSYTLEFVSTNFLKESKDSVPVSALLPLFLNDRPRLHNYCVKDSELVVMLVNFLNILPFAMNLSAIIGLMTVGDLYKRGQMVRVVSCLMVDLKKRTGNRVLLPTPGDFVGSGGRESQARAAQAPPGPQEDASADDFISARDDAADLIVESYMDTPKDVAKRMRGLDPGGDDGDDAEEGEEDAGDPRDRETAGQTEGEGTEAGTDAEDGDGTGGEADEGGLAPSEGAGRMAPCRAPLPPPSLPPKKALLTDYFGGRKDRAKAAAVAAAPAPNVGTKRPASGLEKRLAQDRRAADVKKNGPRLTKKAKKEATARSHPMPGEYATNEEYARAYREYVLWCVERGKEDLKATPGKSLPLYDGAINLEPIKGFHADSPVINLDFVSLYPSIIIAYNISKDTWGFGRRFLKQGFAREDLDNPSLFAKASIQVVDPKTGSPQDSYFRQRLVCTREEALLRWASPAELDDPEVWTREPPGGGGEATYTLRSTVGRLPAVLEGLLALRKSVKEAQKRYHPSQPEWKTKEAQQLACKLIANSGYGALGNPVSKIGFLVGGASTTGYGCRTLLALIDAVLLKWAGAVIYGGDTDSVHAVFPQIPSLDHVLGEVPRVMAFLNPLFKKPIALDFEEVKYPYFPVAKKRYAHLAWRPYFDPIRKKKVMPTTGEVCFKGVEVMRRDNSRLVTATQKAYLQKVLAVDRVPVQGGGTKSLIKDGKIDKEGLRALIDSANEDIRRKADDLMAGKVGAYDLNESRQKSKETYRTKALPHITVDAFLRERGEPETELGSRCNFVTIAGRPGEKPYQLARPPRHAVLEGMLPDYSYYLHNRLKEPILRFAQHLVQGGKPAAEKLLFGKHAKKKGKAQRRVAPFCERDPLFRHFAALHHCGVCRTAHADGTPCPGAVEDIEDLHRALERKEAGCRGDYEAKLAECRMCMGITPGEEVICDNIDCEKYIPRLEAQRKAQEAASDLRKSEAIEAAKRARGPLR